MGLLERVIIRKRGLSMWTWDPPFISQAQLDRRAEFACKVTIRIRQRNRHPKHKDWVLQNIGLLCGLSPKWRSWEVELMIEVIDSLTVEEIFDVFFLVDTRPFPRRSLGDVLELHRTISELAGVEDL